jgi:hypothetical protein
MKDKKVVDSLQEAENALRTYEHMKSAQQYVIEMLDFHIKQAKAIIAREKKAVEVAFETSDKQK